MVTCRALLSQISALICQNLVNHVTPDSAPRPGRTATLEIRTRRWIGCAVDWALPDARTQLVNVCHRRLLTNRSFPPTLAIS
jgi:hypothetical protein